MLKISMPTASIIDRFDTFLKVLQCNGLECRGNAVANTGVRLSVFEGRCRMY